MRILLCFFLVLKLNGFSQLKELKKSSDLSKEKLNLVSNGSTNNVFDYTKYVNVFIGTGAHGHTHPAATAPFGMIQAGPDTRYNGWDGCSGYHYSDSIIYGFSHTHLSGTGVEDLCDLLIVPQQGKCLTEAGYKSKKGYGSEFSHKNEFASPGFYKVKLDKNDIDAEIASTERSAIHSYKFSTSKKKKFLLIDLAHRDQVLDYEFKVDGNNKISGKRISKSWAKNQHFYFYLETEIPFTKYKLTKNKKLILEFPKGINEVKLKVGISAVDEEGAKKNVFEEITHWNLETIAKQTKAKWNNELSKIEFKATDLNVLTNFYSAKYHTYLTPTLFSDVDGRYRGNDDKIHESLTSKRYTIFSLWDTYRTAHPLYTLTQRERTKDFIQTFLDIYKETGELPVWELWGNETDCMIGYHATSVITDAYLKGITSFQSQTALDAMIASANKNELGKEIYKTQGFIGSNQEPESVSKTLEYAYDDWTIGKFAEAIGNENVKNEFLSRGNNFINIYDPQSKFMRPKNGGIWIQPFSPSEVNFNFTEANSYQYSLAAPQNISLLTDLLGGKDSLEVWLDRLFETESKLEGRHQVDITGLIGQYAHGNEPSHHMAYLYNYTNSKHKTQEKIDQILKDLYSPTPEGLSGNEDCGQMSAWYIMSSMGIYPICPGNPIYTFGRPIQDEATINFEDGKQFIIKTENNSPENKYIDRIVLNGKDYQKTYVDHETLMKGGELTFYMSSSPRQNYSAFETELIENKEVDAIPNPYFTATSANFRDSISTEIKILETNYFKKNNFQIHYTIDGTEPHRKSPIYSRPLTFHETTTLKAKTFKVETYSNKENTDDLFRSGFELAKTNELLAVTNTFHKLKDDFKLEMLTEYNNQYTGGGKFALIDGIYGGGDFRSGPYQGFEAINAEGILYFHQGTNLKGIEISCLQDIKSWIFMPTQIEIQVSYDGIKFEKPIKRVINYQFAEFGNFKEKFGVTINKENVKALKFKIINRKTCPKGHLGEGEKSWIFLDEIEIKH